MDGLHFLYIFRNGWEEGLKAGVSAENVDIFHYTSSWEVGFSYALHIGTSYYVSIYKTASLNAFSHTSLLALHTPLISATKAV